MEKEEMQNYPKVCFGCSRPHIEKVGDEVEIEGGVKVFHKDCAPMQNQDEIPTQEIKVEPVIQESTNKVTSISNNVTNIFAHIFGGKKEGEVA